MDMTTLERRLEEATERADLALFEDHCSDMFHDMPIYLREAAKSCPCERCKGTGEVQLPTDDGELARMLLSAFVRDIGGSSTVSVAGEKCGWCDGSGVDAEKQRAAAAKAFAKDWYGTMQDLFPARLIKEGNDA